MGGAVDYIPLIDNGENEGSILSIAFLIDNSIEPNKAPCHRVDLLHVNDFFFFLML